MSLCYIMQSDFMHGTGRYDDRGVEMYSDRDLRFGLEYAIAYLDEGETHEWLYGYDLLAFGAWCIKRLTLSP